MSSKSSSLSNFDFRISFLPTLVMAKIIWEEKYKHHYFKLDRFASIYHQILSAYANDLYLAAGRENGWRKTQVPGV